MTHLSAETVERYFAMQSDQFDWKLSNDINQFIKDCIEYSHPPEDLPPVDDYRSDMDEDHEPVAGLDSSRAQRRNC